VHRAPKEKNDTPDNAIPASFAIESSEENILTIGAKATFTLRQKTAWIVSPDDKTSVKWFIKNQGEPEKELKQVDYHPYERHLSATVEGVHQIIARVYLNNQLKEEVVYLQRVVKGDPRILKMSITEKMRLAMERSQVWEEIKNEVGDPVQLIAMMIATIAILTLIAETGFGFAAEVLAGIIAALALGVSVKGLFSGIVNLVEFAQIIGYAGTEHDIDKASRKFAEGVAKIGVHALFLLLLYLGVRKNSARVKLQLEEAKVNGKPHPELKTKAEIKDAEEVKDLLPEGKRPEQAKRSPGKEPDLEAKKAEYTESSSTRIDNKSTPYESGGYRFRKRLFPRGSGSSDGPIPDDYTTVSRWINADELKLWVEGGATRIPPEIGGASNRVYVTELGAPKPGGTGPIRVDFAVPKGSLQTAGAKKWFQIFQPKGSVPIYNVIINIP
jgi:hypothetical protein